MSWNASGEDRVKSFSVYKALEEKYQIVLQEVMALKAEIAQKDVTIRQLAKELAGLAEHQEKSDTESVSRPSDSAKQTSRPSRPPLKKSGTMSVREALSVIAEEQNEALRDTQSAKEHPGAYKSIPGVKKVGGDRR